MFEAIVDDTRDAGHRPITIAHQQKLRVNCCQLAGLLFFLQIQKTNAKDEFIVYCIHISSHVLPLQQTFVKLKLILDSNKNNIYKIHINNLKIIKIHHLCLMLESRASLCNLLPQTSQKNNLSIS